MIPELGHFALILALSLALCQGIIPLIGAHKNDTAMMGVARTAAAGQRDVEVRIKAVEERM